MTAWEKLLRWEEDAIWRRFETQFELTPSVTDWPGIREPEASITYHIGHVFGDAERYDRLTLDLSQKLVHALRRCVPTTGEVNALDWQSQCYRFKPDGLFRFDSEDDWPIPALPNGDYYIFVDPALEFGVFGHPWEQTMCVFGQAIIASFAADLPALFDRPIRVGGRVVRLKPDTQDQ